MDKASQSEFLDVKRDRRAELLTSSDMATNRSHSNSLNGANIATVIKSNRIALRAKKLKNAGPSRVTESFKHQDW